MPKSYEEYQKIKDERKNSIIFAAIPLFFSKKRSKIKIDDVTTLAGCSHGLFYHYFKGVDELYLSIKKTPQINEIFTKINDLIYGDEYDSLTRITNYVLKQIIDGNFDNIKFVLVDEDFNKIITQLIGKGQKKKVITGGDPKEIVSSYISILIGLIDLRKIDKDAIIPSADIIMNLARKRQF